MSNPSIPEMFRRYLALDETPELTAEHWQDLAELTELRHDPTTVLMNEWELRYMMRLEQRLAVGPDPTQAIDAESDRPFIAPERLGEAHDLEMTEKYYAPQPTEEMYERYQSFGDATSVTEQHLADLEQLRQYRIAEPHLIHEWEYRYIVRIESKLARGATTASPTLHQPEETAPYTQLTLSFTRAQWLVIDRALTHYCQSRSGSRDLPDANQLLWDIRDSLSEQEKERR